jgi:hypothetical protein
VIDLSDAVYTLTWLFSGGPAPVTLPCTPSAGCALPATGQTVIDTPGDDAFYHAGCPSEGRFVVHGDGTVTDNCTGLEWQKATAPNHYDWWQAIEYCEGLDLGGHTDWRLPNVRELQSIVDYGRLDPAIDPVFGASSAWYWSSTSVAYNPDYAWGVGFGDGFVGSGLDEVGGGCVRAVRSGP